ncbi:MAG: hypothetical protein MRY79_07550 [Alphaproteobacteria bacterium]|nr:hypothetical protein [Alphaproteobacteria bacterium]
MSVYIFGLFGFVMGFGVGLGVINVFLRHYSNEKIKNDKSLRWTYGLAVWVFAALGAWLGIWLYHNSFI